MKYVVSLCLAITVWTTSLPVLAQTLWRETTIGMSEPEVRRLIPEAAAPTNKPGSLASGDVELLRIDQFELLNEKFSVSFYFKDERLSQVTLSLATEKSFESALRTFDSVTEALRAKYGRELSRRVSSQPFLSAEAAWLSGRTNINVFAFSVAKGHLIFNINYQVRLVREADKL